MMLARQKLKTSRILLKLKTRHAKLLLLMLITLPSLKMMAAKLKLLLSMPELMLRLLPETERTRPLVKESARKSQIVRQQLQHNKQEETHRMKTDRETLRT